MLAATLLSAATDADVSADAPVGAIGCSNTVRILDESPAMGVDSMFWPGREDGQRRHAYGGGVLGLWADTGSDEWLKFVEYMDTYPHTTRVVWQVCNHYRRATQPSPVDIALTGQIANNVAVAYPQVVLYSVGLHTPPECSRIGAAAVDVAMADLVADGRYPNVVRGPMLTQLTAYDGGAGTTVQDNCHQTSAGAASQLADLVAFFE